MDKVEKINAFLQFTLRLRWGSFGCERDLCCWQRASQIQRSLINEARPIPVHAG